MRGIRKPLLWLMTLALLGPSASRAGLRAPLSGRGAFDFVADMPVFPTGGERSRVDLAVRVDHRQLRFRPGYGHPFLAEVALHLKIAREGLVAVDTTQVYEFTAENPDEANDPRRFELIEMPLYLTEGNWAVTISLVDRQASSEGLHRKAESRATGVLHVPRIGTPALSDLEFRLGQGEGGGLPNPERVYGVVQDTLVGYFEVRGDSATAAHHSVTVEVEDPVYGGMDSQLLSFDTSPGRQARLYRLPLDGFPEGNYVLRFEPAWGAADEAREYEFSVVWKMGRITARGGDLVLEAKLVLPEDELEKFTRLSPAAQATVLEDFWSQHDPTPGTSRNETYDAFRQRVAYARRFLGEALVPGPLTDRGRIYVRYGPPKSREVHMLPSNDDDLAAAITRVHDAYGVEFEGVIAREAAGQGGDERDRRAAAERDLIASRDRRRLTTRVGSEGSFELWIYDFDGDPLFDEQAKWSENIGYRFLFVDRRGDGSYHLEFTNLANRP
jgi:GWxTD domain-containing protein